MAAAVFVGLTTTTTIGTGATAVDFTAFAPAPPFLLSRPGGWTLRAAGSASSL
jgi:hypothetical protein